MCYYVHEYSELRCFKNYYNTCEYEDDDCYWIHDTSNPKHISDNTRFLYKTHMCKNHMSKDKKCVFGNNCHDAHNLEEFRCYKYYQNRQHNSKDCKIGKHIKTPSPISYYKTNMCENSLEKGKICNKGKSCFYAHK